MIDRDDVLGRLIGDSHTEILPDIHSIPDKTLSVEELWRQFGERIAILGGRVSSLNEFLATPFQRTFVDASATAYVPQRHVAPEDSLWSCEVSVSMGVLAVAESGTVVVSAGISCARLSTLAPPHAAILVRRNDIVLTLEESFDRLPRTTTALLTGPSRTADIEGTLVRGVHGPGEVTVIPVD